MTLPITPVNRNIEYELRCATCGCLAPHKINTTSPDFRECEDCHDWCLIQDMWIEVPKGKHNPNWRKHF